MEQNYIESEKRSWFTMLPNIVDDMGLDPYAFRLYVHLRRVAGEHGACWQSTETLKDLCKMSMGAVSKAKQTLVKAGLIRIEERKRNGTMHHHITIVDIWARNFAHYASQQEQNPGPPADEPQPPSPDESALSGGETKKNPPEEVSTNGNNGSHSGDSVPANLEDWMAVVEAASNKQAALVRMYAALFPYKGPFNDYGYIGRVAKNVGGECRMAQLMWIAAGYRPTGDVLRYCQGLARGAPPKQVDNGGIIKVGVR